MGKEAAIASIGILVGLTGLLQLSLLQMAIVSDQIHRVNTNANCFEFKWRQSPVSSVYGSFPKKKRTKIEHTCVNRVLACFITFYDINVCIKF